MKYRPEMTQELLMQFTHYDPNTGVLKRTHAMSSSHKIYAKEFIPQSTTLGYRTISLFKTPHMIHRLAFLYMNGVFPNEVDHINGERLDNRWCNLREVDARGNRMNRGLPSNNRSGVMGVYYYPRYDKWEVTITNEGKHMYLGRYAKFEDAVKVRLEAEVKYGYHANHGKRLSHR